jgi:hypothetical protein
MPVEKLGARRRQQIIPPHGMFIVIHRLAFSWQQKFVSLVVAEIVIEGKFFNLSRLLGEGKEFNVRFTIAGLFPL